MRENTLRLLILSPSFARDEQRRAEDIIDRLNAAFDDEVRIDLVNPDKGLTYENEHQTIVALLRPRLDTDEPDLSSASNSSSPIGKLPARDGMSQILSAIDRRPPGASFPDIYIYRYLAPGFDDPKAEENWQRGKDAFASWVSAKGGKYLKFKDFSSPSEFGSKLEEQLLAWPARLGIVLPEKTFAPATPDPDIVETSSLPPEPEPLDVPLHDMVTPKLEPSEMQQGEAPIPLHPQSSHISDISTASSPVQANVDQANADIVSEQAEMQPESLAHSQFEKVLPFIMVSSAPMPMDDTASAQPTENTLTLTDAITAALKQELSSIDAENTAETIAEVSAYKPVYPPAPPVVDDKVASAPSNAVRDTNDGTLDDHAENAEEDRQPVASTESVALLAPGASFFPMRSHILSGAQPIRTPPPDYPSKRLTPRRTLIIFAVAAFFILLALFAWQLRNDARQTKLIQPGAVLTADMNSAGGLSTGIFSKSSPETIRVDPAAADPKAAPAPADLLLRQSRAETLLNSATSYMAQGNAIGALDAATQAREIYRTLSSADPNAAEWWSGLVASNAIVGDSLVAQTRADDALVAYGQSIAASKTLLTKQPDNSELLKGLSANYEKATKILSTEKRDDDALAVLRDSLVIRQTLANKEPDNADIQRSLSATQERIGDLFVIKGRLEEGLAAYREGLVSRAALALKNPDNAEFRHDLFESKSSIGDALAAQGRFEDALAAYRDGFSDAKAMALKYPDDVRWPRALTLSDEKIGDVLAGLHRLDDALAAYRDGLLVMKNLASKDPDNTEWQSLISTANERIGDVFVMENHLDSALTSYRDDLAGMKILAQKDPSNSAWQLGISESQGRIGDVLNEQHHPDEAMSAYQNSLSAIRGFVQREPDNTRWQRNLMVAESKVAQMLMVQGHRSEALSMYHDALAVAMRMTPRDPSNANWQNSQTMIDSNIGALLMGFGRHDEAMTVYHDANMIAEELTHKDPNNIEWQNSFVISLYNLADAGENPTENFTQALEILKRLDNAGTLPSDKKGLIANIETKLSKIKHRSPVAMDDKKKSTLH